MPIWNLDESLCFPNPMNSEEDGLLAVNGDLSPERLLLAYSMGIFPWYAPDDPLLWWSPDPRFVLFPEKLKISKSMQQVFRKKSFEYRSNKAFEAVIRNCAHTPRKGEKGTWIHEEMIIAYAHLHQLGFAHSAESWKDGELVGGLYGVRLGNIFFGESMFSNESNASKAAFINLVQNLQQDGVRLIDCQMHTSHLESLGAESLSKKLFLSLLNQFSPTKKSEDGM